MPTTHEELIAAAEYHHSRMSDRRSITLKVLVGLVTFDLLLMKLAVDSVKSVAHVGELAWLVGIAACSALIGSVGMMIQIELSNARDRREYRTAEAGAKALRGGQQPGPDVEETWVDNIKRSWATTWPLIGLVGLTAAVCWFASLLKP